MKTEYEIKILEIDVKEIEKRLVNLNATKILDRNMRRYVYRLDKDERWIRLRDDGEKVTLTYKEIQNENIYGTKEIEVEVDSFEETHNIFKNLGFRYKYQENKRTSYKLGCVEIEIDSWPRIPTYLEIEGTSEKEVKKVVELLGFQMSQTTTLNTRYIYDKYGIDITTIDTLKF